MGIINNHPLVLNNLSVDAKANPTLSDACRQVGIDAVYEFLPNEAMPRHVAPREKMEEKSLIEIDLLKFISQFQAEAILNGLTDAAWDAYVKQLDTTYRYKEWLQWQQDYVDHKF
jgi:putative aldouronate transport system substrate-binding protein